jgi:hypothetical protein
MVRPADGHQRGDSAHAEQTRRVLVSRVVFMPTSRRPGPLGTNDADLVHGPPRGRLGDMGGNGQGGRTANARMVDARRQRPDQPDGRWQSACKIYQERWTADGSPVPLWTQPPLPSVNAARANVGPRGREWRGRDPRGLPLPDRGQAATLTTRHGGSDRVAEPKTGCPKPRGQQSVALCPLRPL